MGRLCYGPILSWGELAIGRVVQQAVDGLGGAVGCASDWRPGGRGFEPR